MAWTEQDYQEIVARLMASSIGVNEVPNADKADDVTSLPAFKPSGSNSEASVVNYPLEFLKGEQGEPGIQGEPGKSFKVAGEYDTLEALKSAVPDGSAVDGFMAVGTEAPYDYYAWVDGEWVSQGKIAGGGSGNVVIIPIMGLTTQSTSDEIFNAFGGKQNLIDIIKKVKDEDCVVIAKTDDDPNAVLQQTFSVVNATYVNDNNLILGLISWSVNVTSQMIIQVIDGVASYNEISTPLMTEAPSNGNAYGRKNKGWVEVPEKSDVLTKDNETEFTPTQDYHPSTKKYVDDKVYVVNNSTWEEVLRNNKSINGTDVQALVNKLFGSYSEFLSLLQGVNDNVYIGLKFTDWMYDDANGYGVGSSYTAGNLYAKHNTAEGEFNCNFTYFYNNALKSCIINVNEAANHNLDVLVVQDIVTSDNLTTLTKKTAAEYEAIGSKDDNTAYCVTD